MNNNSTKMEINILVTLNEVYIPHLNTLLYSVLSSDPDIYLRVYLLHTSVRDQSLIKTRQILDSMGGELICINADELTLDGAPTTERFPKEIYYRIFVAKFLPEDIDKVLYLDPDIIVKGSLKKLYSMDISDHYFAAASHNGAFMRAINGRRLKMKKSAPYINSGVMLINLKKLRREQVYSEVFSFIEDNKKRLILPDQDIISALYGDKILELDPYIYNMTERQFVYSKLVGKGIDMEWIENNTVIIHYCGKNKPWRRKYKGKLNMFYDKTASDLGGLRETVTIE